MKLSRIAAAAALTAAISAPAFAVDGAYDTTASVGTTQITASVGAFARVSAIDDPIALAPIGLDLGYTDSICLFKSGADNQAVTISFASASGTAPAFEMTDGTNLLPYNLTLNAAATNYVAANGTPITTATGASDNVADCTGNGGANASYTLLVPEATLNTAVSGVYTDTITITLSAL